MVRGTRILCKLEHEVGGDTTFSYRGHNHQKHVFCNVSHDGKDPSPYDNWGTDIVQNDIVMHALEDQAFFLAAKLKTNIVKIEVNRK